MAKSNSVFGIYSNRAQLEYALYIFRQQGFSDADVSILVPCNVGSKDLITEKSTKAPEGAAVGAGSGAVIGGVLGWLAGIGALAFPEIGPLIAAGPFVATLAGLGAGGTLGGITGSLIGSRIPEYEAKRYEGHVSKGGILLSVHSDDSGGTKHAWKILKRTGAADVSLTAVAKAS